MIGRTTLAAVALLFASLAAAQAQMPTAAQKSAIKSACRADYQAHCASITPGGQAALTCLQQNMQALSPSCQSAVGAIGGSASSASPMQSQPGSSPSAPQPSPRAEMAAVRGACRADYRVLCRGVRLGGGRAIQCLRDNAASLSPGCSGLLSRMAGG